ncbi:MAG: hypothetical protein KBF51_10455 [Chitinophagales bacterium]|nr:hypothetical protein [Bacteroidota bacterium]MBP9189952.1 hypothetical protein [Chitinophagales bacterium]
MNYLPLKSLLASKGLFLKVVLCLLLINTLPLFGQEICFNTTQKITTQNDELGWKYVYNLLDSAEIFKTQDSYATAQLYYEKALLLSSLQNNIPLQIDISRKQGKLAYDAGYNSQSFNYYKYAKQIAEKNNLPEMLVLTNLDLGTVFLNEGKPDSSQYYILQSLRWNNAVQDTISLINAYHLLGDIHYGVENYHDSHDYYQKGIDLIVKYNALTEDLIYEYSLLLGNQAGIYAELREFEKSKKCYAKSDSLARLIDDKHTLAFNAYGLGYTYYYEGNYNKSIDLCKNALSYFVSENDAYSIEGTLECIARSYLGLNQLDSAEFYLLSVLKSMDNFNYIDFKMDIYEQLTSLYEKKGDYQTSLHYNKLFKKFSDSLNVQNRSVNLNLLEIQQRYAQAEKDNLALVKDRVKDQKIISEQQKSNLLITIAFIFAMACVFTLIIIYRNKRYQSALLEQEVQRRTVELSASNLSLLEANAELEEFAYISSHDLREPIRNIVSFSSLIKRKGEKLSQAELNDFISLIQFNGNQMTQLVNDIYEFTKIKKVNFDLKSVALNSLINDALRSLSPEIKKKHVEIETDIHTGNILTHTNMLVLALRNIIENGITYNKSEIPEIHILAVENDLEYTISIKDNGIGINPKYHGKIFEMFKRLHNREEYSGSGLGLAITKKIITRLKGSIDVISEEGSGSTFIIRIPKKISRIMSEKLKRAS